MQKLGQHFLTDDHVLERITSSILSDDVLRQAQDKIIIEIGPGHGELTHKLGDRLSVMGDSKRQKTKIIAIEKDTELVRDLREKFANTPQVETVEGDAL